MKDLIKRFYQGFNSKTYDKARKNNPKWIFEENILSQVLKEIHDNIESVIDVPIGTGHALEVLLGYNKITVTGIDLSKDMIKMAKTKDTRGKVTFINADIFSYEKDVRADLVICYRFLNLVDWSNATMALTTMMGMSNKYFLFTIRTVPDTYDGKIFIEDKIYLHLLSNVQKVIRDNYFEVSDIYEFADERVGDYKIILCKRTRQITSCRVNKNQRIVINYNDFHSGLGKLYEVHNALHARFIEEFTSRDALKDYFPRIKSVQNHFIDAEWVEGELLLIEQWPEVLSLMQVLYSSNTSGESSFDYVRDLVIPRFLKAATLLGRETCDRIIKIIESSSGKYEKRLSHPDLIPGNVLKTANGIVVIDNELLCFTPHYRIDILNMLHNLPQNHRGLIAQNYLKQKSLVGDSVQKDEKEYLSALWLARQVGSLILSGKTSEVFQIWARYSNEQNILPYDLFSLNELRSND